MLFLTLIQALLERTRSLLFLTKSSHSWPCWVFIPEQQRWSLGGNHSKRIGDREGTFSNGGHAEINKGTFLAEWRADPSTLRVGTVLSARGQMSSLLPLRVIKISLSLKMTFSVSLHGCVILVFFFFFFPWKAKHFGVYGVGRRVWLTPMCWWDSSLALDVTLPQGL